MRKPPIIHSTRPAESSHFLRVELLDLEFSNGERRTYERLKGSGLGAVVIVPMLDDDTVLLVREYGAGIDRYEVANAINDCRLYARALARLVRQALETRSLSASAAPR